MLKRNILLSKLSKKLLEAAESEPLDSNPPGSDSIHAEDQSYDTATHRTARLSLCIAPSGYGKTVTAKQWQALCTKPQHTLTQTTHPQFYWITLSHMLTSEAQIKQLISEPINDIISDAHDQHSKDNNKAQHRQLVFIIDNIHNISTDLASHQLLDMLTELNKPTIAILMLGRYSPFALSQADKRHHALIQYLLDNSLSLHDFKFSQSEEDLLFYSKSDEDSSSMERPVYALGFSKDEYQEINQITKLTSGWPALLDLIQHYGIQKQPDLIFQSISYYFETLISSELDETALDILCNSAILPKVNQSLYQSFFGISISQSELLELEKRFYIQTITINNTLFWHITNPLLRDYLARSARAENPASIQKISQKAVSYYLEEKLFFEAINLAIFAGWHDQAITTIIDNKNVFNDPSAWQYIADCFREIPDHILENHPGLSDLLAWQYISSLNQAPKNPIRERIPRSETLSSITQKTEEEAQELSIDLSKKLEPIVEKNLDIYFNEVQSIEKTIAFFTRYAEHEHTETMKQSPTVRTGKNKATSHPSSRSMHPKNANNIHEKCTIHSIPVWQLFQGAHQAILQLEFTTAFENLETIINISMKTNSIRTVCNCLVLYILISHIHSDYTKLKEIVSTIQIWAKKNRFQTHPFCIWISSANFLYLLENNQLEACSRIVNRLKRSIANSADSALSFVTHYFSALLSISLNNHDAAWNDLEAMDLSHIHFSQPIFRVIAPHQILKLTLLLRQKYFYRASQVFNKDTALASLQSTEDINSVTFDHLISAFIRRIQNNDSSVDHEISSIKQIAEKKQFVLLALHATLLQAIIKFKDSQNKQAAERFTEALLYIQTQSYKRSLLNYGPYSHYLFILIQENLSNKKSGTAMFIDFYKESLDEPSYKEVDPIFLTLSKREREIFKLISEGKSNDEIATELCRSVGTIKLHLHSIFQKLGVKKRFQATELYHKFGIE